MNLSSLLKPYVPMLTAASVALATVTATQAAVLVNVLNINPTTSPAGNVTATSVNGTFSTTTGSTILNNNGGNPATQPALVNSTTYGLKLTDLIIDGVSGIELTWDLTLTANSGSGVVLNGPAWTVETSPGGPVFDLEAFRINVGETLTFLVDNIVAAATNGGSVTNVSFIGFTGLDLVNGNGGSFSNATGVVSHNGGDPATADFRVQNLDTQFSIAAVPEPSVIGLFGLTGLALLVRRRK